MSKTHHLKTWPEYFSAIVDGTKRFEIRPNDRGFAVGDTLVLHEYDITTHSYSGRVHHCTVTYLVSGSWGIPDDLCVMSIRDVGGEP